jgi:DtxR family Mn-dependent transcriptional regulator
MKDLPDLSSSLEDYLETIFDLEKRYRVARVKDIAEALEVQMPSVTGALKTLRNRGLVQYEKNSFIQLTETGRKTAQSVATRHASIRKFLSDTLCLSVEEAESTACKIEHVVSPELARRLSNLDGYLHSHRDAAGMDREDWLRILTETDPE